MYCYVISHPGQFFDSEKGPTLLAPRLAHTRPLAYSGQHTNSAMLQLGFAHPVDRQGICDAQRIEALLFTHPALQHLVTTVLGTKHGEIQLDIMGIWRKIGISCGSQTWLAGESKTYRWFSRLNIHVEGFLSQSCLITKGRTILLGEKWWFWGYDSYSDFVRCPLILKHGNIIEKPLAYTCHLKLVAVPIKILQLHGLPIKLVHMSCVFWFISCQ